MGAFPARRHDADPREHPVLRAVPDAGTEEYDRFVDELVREERRVTARAAGAEDAKLLALGLPVATPYGDDIPTVAAPNEDTDSTNVRSLEVARLRRYMRELPTLERKVLELRFGFSGRELSAERIAHRLGLSRADVARVEQRALDGLRHRFGVTGS